MVHIAVRVGAKVSASRRLPDDVAIDLDVSMRRNEGLFLHAG